MSDIKMINCPQCGNAVSSASKSCPNPYNGRICGHNVTRTQEIGTIVIGAALLLAGFIYWAYNEIAAFFS